MFPQATLFNSVNSWNRNTEATSDVHKDKAAFKQITNDRNIVVNQLGISLSHSSNVTTRRKHMFRVFQSGAPFKIFNTIVRAFVVNMINNVTSLRRIAKKRISDYAMNAMRQPAALFRQSYLRIPVFIKGGQAQETILPCPVSSSEAFNAPKIRHFVKPFVSNDRLPDFIIDFFGGKLGNSHRRLISRINVYRLGLTSRLRDLSACFYFTTLCFHTINLGDI